MSDHAKLLIQPSVGCIRCERRTDISRLQSAQAWWTSFKSDSWRISAWTGFRLLWACARALHIAASLTWRVSRTANWTTACISIPSHLMNGWCGFSIDTLWRCTRVDTSHTFHWWGTRVSKPIKDSPICHPCYCDSRRQHSFNSVGIFRVQTRQ